MADDDKHAKRPSDGRRLPLAVDPLLIAALRRREGMPVPAPDEPWTACAAPGNLLVIAADGATSACEYARAAPRSGTPDAAFDDSETAALRAALAAGNLPATPCGPCASRLLRGLTAPPVRDYGGLPTTPAPTPRQIALQLPAARPLAPPVAAALPRLLASCEQLTVESPADEPSDLTTLLAALPKGRRLAVTLRCARPVAAESAARAIAEVAHLTRLEWTTIGDDLADLPGTLSLAARLGARLAVHFVVDPKGWHHLGAWLAACDPQAVELRAHVFDRGERLPMAALRSEDLAFVRCALAASRQAFGGDSPHDRERARAVDTAVEELRHLLLDRANADATGETAAAGALSLPGPGHPWFETPPTWWLHQLFGHAHLAAIRSWVEEVVQGASPRLKDRERAWLRVLAQRVASEHPNERLLGGLRNLYAVASTRKALVAADAGFAAGFDLSGFGGPWAGRLGLARPVKRQPPFPRRGAMVPATGPADVTVLVPSFRHEDFIAESLRSVLAQTHANHRLLVVDDCSPDGTAACARQVDDPRIRVLVNERNLGLGNSVLHALEHIDTPYVALLNSDDLFHPSRLERCRQILERDTDAQLVTTGMHLIDSAGGELTPTNTSLVLDGRKVHDWVHWFAAATPDPMPASDRMFEALLERNFLVTSSNIFARTDWLRRQADSLRCLKYCLDWRLFLEAAREGVLRHLQEPLLAYRLHASNTVWFGEGRRWSYFLEVNRVAAEALQRCLAAGRGPDDERLLRVVAAVARHIAANTETDGAAMFLNAATGPTQLDDAAHRQPQVQQLIRELNARAESLRHQTRMATSAVDGGAASRAGIRALLDQLIQELLRTSADRERWHLQHEEELLRQQAVLRREHADLQGRLTDLYDDQKQRIARAQELETQIRELYDDQKQRIARAQELENRIRELYDDQKQRIARAQELENRIRELYDDQKQRIARAQELENRIRLLYDDQKQRIARAQELENRIRELYDDQKQRIARAQELENRIRELQDERTRSLEHARLLEAEQDALRQERDRIRGELGQAVDQLAAARHQAAELQATVATITQRLEADRAKLIAALAGQAAAERRLEEPAGSQPRILDSLAALERSQQHLEQALQAERSAHAKAASRIAELDQSVARLEAGLAAETAQVRDLVAAKDRLSAERRDLVHELARVREEIARLLASREFRAGNFLWNKMPLAYLSRRGKKWYRRLVDAKNRCVALLRRRRRAEGVAVVAACWQWPIYSHTFVYQEMIGLTHMGLDVQMFHWDLGDTGQLHQAFAYLAEHRTQLQPLWDQHKKDKEHFEKTRPGRLRAFLDLVAARTGRKVEDLEKEPLVLQACTFARMAELAGAKYLHSYFFYDQSFMAMQAAWLLGIPRGISCYADHMLDDYPFKLVGLHVELASVVVATSARIKSELSAKSGGRFDDKIIVKPNGVDGARFPPIQRPDRRPGEPIEAVSISRIEPKKGLTYLVEAVAELKRRGHRLIVHVIGSKDPHSKGSLEYAAEFERRIAELGVGDEIVLHGMKKQEELPPILQRCRAFVAPYVEVENGDKDGIPTAMLEGLASCLPVVTTDSGSILEVVRHEVEALVVPQRDGKALADAFERLIRDPALERRLAKAARARFDREFDIRVTEKRLHERIAALVGKAAKSP